MFPPPLRCLKQGTETGSVKVRCRTVDDIAREALRIIGEEKDSSNEPRAEFFFRGESRNHKSDYDGDPLGTAFQSYLDRLELVEYERELYEEAMRLNVASFEEDRTMVERVDHFIVVMRRVSKSLRRKNNKLRKKERWIYES